MSYYQFNRQEILPKVKKKKYFKEKAAEYYVQNKEAIKEKSRERYKNLSQEERDKIKDHQRKRYQQLVQHKKEALQNKRALFLLSVRLGEKTLTFNNIRLNKKQFHKSKQSTDLKSVNVDQIIVCDKFKNSDKGFKYFVVYQEDEIVKPLCIILPQMSGYIKYFENCDKNMSFFIKDDEVWEKYKEIWDKIKNKLNIKFHSKAIFDGKRIKTKVRKFDGVVKTKLFR